jgi:dynein assembly factor 6, axonemal
MQKKSSCKTIDADSINKLAIKLEEKVKIQPENLEEWLAAEVQENKDILDNRKRPNYTVSYKQAVKTEDIYLQVISIIL